MPVLKRYFTYILVAVVAFALGFWPQHNTQRQLARTNQQLDTELELTQLRTELVLAAFNIEQKKFDIAADHSQKFFEKLQRRIARTENTPRKQRFERIAHEREGIISLIDNNDKAAAEKLMRIYQELYELSRGTLDRMARADGNSCLTI
ncbi:MAG: hypothetical protein AB1489_18360 [Acidobacteriota bacterium]